MSEFPTDALYSEEHEYLLPSGEDGVYTIGITDYAQGELDNLMGSSDYEKHIGK